MASCKRHEASRMLRARGGLRGWLTLSEGGSQAELQGPSVIYPQNCLRTSGPSIICAVHLTEEFTLESHLDPYFPARAKSNKEYWGKAWSSGSVVTQ
jgi:hypothetical protein